MPRRDWESVEWTLCGDIFLTRNAGGEEANPSPGYYNHAAIVVVDEHGPAVIEAQAHVTPDGQCSDDASLPGRVILTPIERFVARYPIVLLRGYKNNLPEECRRAMALAAAKFVAMNTDYRFLASLFFRRSERRGTGVNCVSLVRSCAIKGLRWDPGWRRPDHIAGDRRLQDVWFKGTEQDARECAVPKFEDTEHENDAASE